MDVVTFNSAIRAGLLHKNWELLDDWFAQESSFSYNYGTICESEQFDDEVFTTIIALLSKEEFCQAEGSYNILRVLEYDWSLLTDTQKLRLLSALEKAYPKFNQDMAWFLISEILGEYYANLSSLQVLLNLKIVEKDEARLFVANGLENIIKNCAEDKVIQIARTELIRMKSDLSELVRNNVETSIKRVEAYYNRFIAK